MSNIELDAKGYRLYVQGVNDSLIHSIEITSGIVIQTIGESHVQCSIGRQTFTVAPCGSMWFKSIDGAKIGCWNQSNADAVNTLKLPIVGGRAFISSLIYHPSKLLLACTIYGDTKSTCILLMGCENINGMHQPLQTIQNDNDHDETVSAYIEMPSSKKLVPAARTLGTFGNILNRIDDLFALAIKSPNRTDDYKQRKQLEISLQQLKAPIQLLSSDLNGSEQAVDSMNSTECENYNKSSKLVEHSDSSSIHSNNSKNSNNTFTLERPSKSDDDANDDHTFNVENSDQNSNATLKIENERNSSGRSIVADVNTKTKVIKKE